MSVGHLGVEKDLVTVPLMHDSVGELAQPFGGTDWKKCRCGAGPRQERAEPASGGTRLPEHLQAVHLPGPDAGKKLGNGGKGINWNTDTEVKFLGELNHKEVEAGISQGRPKKSTAPLMLPK
nr:hypothetical protein GCM10020185_71660 [Pseudomonas brassicacearum subsp. brassicacearum]